MEHCLTRKPRRRPAHGVRRRPPFFFPVVLKARHDGWDEARQCRFLALLYLTGSVCVAAKAVGKSRASVYRLRQRAGAEEFAYAWKHVLTPPETGRVARPRPDWRKVTNAELVRRIKTGRIQPVIYRGRMTAIRRKADKTALLRLLKRLDAHAQAKGAHLRGTPPQSFGKSPPGRSTNDRDERIKAGRACAPHLKPRSRLELRH